jgi:hypothetical protein
LLLKADIDPSRGDVGFVPKGDILRRSLPVGFTIEVRSGREA